MTLRVVLIIALGSAVSACAASPYDFPVPVMVAGRPATSMTGYGLPGKAEFLSLETQRADNAVGTHILHHNAVMRCAEPPTPG